MSMVTTETWWLLPFIGTLGLVGGTAAGLLALQVAGWARKALPNVSASARGVLLGVVPAPLFLVGLGFGNGADTAIFLLAAAVGYYGVLGAAGWRAWQEAR